MCAGSMARPKSLALMQEQSLAQGGNNVWEHLTLRENNSYINILDVHLKRWAGNKQGKAVISVKAMTDSVQIPTYELYSQMFTAYY